MVFGVMYFLTISLVTSSGTRMPFSMRFLTFLPRGVAVATSVLKRLPGARCVKPWDWAKRDAMVPLPVPGAPRKTMFMDNSVIYAAFYKNEPLEGHSCIRNLNPRPPDYKSGALRLSYKGMEEKTGRFFINI